MPSKKKDIQQPTLPGVGEQTPLPEAAKRSDPETWKDDLENAPVYDVTADGGAGSGKAFWENIQAFFPAVVSHVPLNEMKFDSTKNDEKNIVLEWHGFQWAVGNYALESKNGTMRRLDQEQLGDEIHQVILLSCILQVVPEHRARIRLTTNIPLEFWKQREMLRAQLKGVYKGYYNDAPFYFEIVEVIVHPETRGIVCAYLLDDFGQQVYTFGDKPLACIDLGAHTGNVGLYKRFTPVNGSFTLTNFGWRTVWAHCTDVIKQRTGRRVTYDEVEAAVRFQNGKIWVGSTEIDLLNDHDFYPTGYDIVAKQLMAAIQDKFKGGSMFAVAIGGGGLWPHIASKVAQAFPNQYKAQAEFATVKDVPSYMLNALGMERRKKAQIAEIDG